jgi:hypothetical protein
MRDRIADVSDTTASPLKNTVASPADSPLKAMSSRIALATVIAT